MGLGRLARCRALLADDNQAEGLYQESLEVLRDADLTTESGTETPGLRRVASASAPSPRGPQPARRRFRRVRRHGRQGLRRAGPNRALGHRRPRASQACGSARELTAQETQVATLVVAGDTNREAAAKLFISPATVEYHLRHVYQKFGVSSRTQLARSMAMKERELRPVR